MRSERHLRSALLLDALRDYEGPVALKSLVLLEKGQHFRLSFKCTRSKNRIMRSAKHHRQGETNVSVRADATQTCIHKLAEYILTKHSFLSENHSEDGTDNIF